MTKSNSLAQLMLCHCVRSQVLSVLTTLSVRYVIFRFLDPLDGWKRQELMVECGSYIKEFDKQS